MIQVYHPTYDPMEKCKNQPILVHFQCAPPSVRKQCRADERERLAKLTSLNEPPQQNQTKKVRHNDY